MKKFCSGFLRGLVLPFVVFFYQFLTAMAMAVLSEGIVKKTAAL